MMHKNSIFKNKAFKIRTAIMIALICVFAVVGISFAFSNNAINSNTNNDESASVMLSKEATWISDNFSKAKVEITGEGKGKGQGYVPKVLFLGTLCGAHELKRSTVNNSLNEISTKADMDYYLFNNSDEALKKLKAGLDQSEYLKKGDKPKEFPKPNPEKVDGHEIDGSSELFNRNHQALGKFLDTLYDELIVKEKSYDFLIFEFDGTQIADYYNTKGQPQNPKSQHELDVANKLKEYYQKQKVAWITMHEIDEEGINKGYYPQWKYRARSADQQLNKEQYNALFALTAPDLYKEQYDQIELKDYEDHALGHNRQCQYNDSTRVSTFLKESIESLFYYELKFDDKIHTDQGCKITDKYFMIQDREKGGDFYRYTGPDQEFIFQDDGSLVARIWNRLYHEYVKLVVEFETTDGTKSFKNISTDGDPNDGPATITLTTTDKEVHTDQSSTKNPIQWPIDIYYFAGEGGSVSNDKDASIWTYLSLEDDSFKGSVPNPNPGYEFIGWTNSKDQSVDFVKVGDSYKPPQNDYSRNMPDTYTAHFRKLDDAVIIYDASGHGIVDPSFERLNPKTGDASGSVAYPDEGYNVYWTNEEGQIVSEDASFVPVRPETGWADKTRFIAHFEPSVNNLYYQINGDDVYGCPSDASYVEPIRDIEYDGSRELYDPSDLKTEWNTAAGKDVEGSPYGKWTFDGWYDKQEAGKKIDFVEHIRKDVTVYGKWTFTPAEITVKFDLNGHGSIKPLDQSIRSGEKAKDPDYPQDPSFNFEGWYTTPQCDDEHPFDFDNTNIYIDTTLYAKWIDKNMVEIYYIPDSSNGGKCLPYQEELYEDASDASGSYAQANEGYEFLGWTKYGDQSIITTDEKFVPKKEPGEKWIDKTTYVAHFKKIELKLNYNVIGDLAWGEPYYILPKEDPSIAYGTKDYKLAKQCETKDASAKGVDGKWTFEGWYSDKERTVIIENNILSGPIKENTTVYGKWSFEPNVHDVIFDLQGHEVPGWKYDQSVEDGSYAQRPDVDPQDPGFEFMGWYTNPECTVIFDFENTPIFKKTIVYAKWIENENVEIDYEADPSYGGKVDPSFELLNPVIGIANGSKATPNEGYKFVNWTVKGSTEPVSFDPSFIPEKIGEKWEPTTYVAHFEFALKIDKQVNKEEAKASEKLEYQISVTNTTASKVINATVTDKVPDGLINIEASSYGVYDEKTRTITYSGFDINPGSNINLTFTANIPENLSHATEYKNTAKLKLGDTELVSNEVKTRALPATNTAKINKNWSDSAGMHVDDSVEVVLYQFANGEESEVDRYTLNNSNNWTTETKDLYVYDEQGNLIDYYIFELDKNGNPVRNHGIWALNENKNYTASYNIVKDNKGIFQSASVTNTYNISKDDLSITKTVDKKVAEPGSDINYTITAINKALGGHASNVVIEDPLPNGLIYVSSSPTGSYDKQNHKLTWKIDKLIQGTPAFFTVKCRVPDDAKSKTYENTAVIVGYGSEIPDETPAPQWIINPPEKTWLGVNITKSIVRTDQSKEIDYVFTNEEQGNHVNLRYYCFKYKADALYNPEITDILPLGLLPDPDVEYPDWIKWSDPDPQTGRYTVKMMLNAPLTKDKTPINLPVLVDPGIDKRTTLISNSMLIATIYEDPSSEAVNALSNDTEMLVLVEEHHDPIPVPDPPIVDVKTIDAIKTWDDGIDKHTTDSITLTLYANGEAKASQEISAKTGWKCTWKDLPIKDETKTIIKYEVKETKGLDGYTSTVSEDEDGNFNVANKKNFVPPTPEPTPTPIPKTVDEAHPLSQTGDIISLLAIFGILGIIIIVSGITFKHRKNKR